MTEQKALQILKDENLKYYNWYNSENLREDQVVILKKDSQWCVCVTSERASIMPETEFHFQIESKALEDFISRVRSMNRLKNRVWQ